MDNGRDRDDHIQFNGIPLSVKIDTDTRTEIEKVRQLEVSEKKIGRAHV